MSTTAERVPNFCMPWVVYQGYVRGLAWSKICGSPDVVESFVAEPLLIIDCHVPQVTLYVRNND